MNTFKSDISGEDFPEEYRISGKLVGKPVLDFIRKEHPEFDESCCLALSELTEYRSRYISDYMQKEVGCIDAGNKGSIAFHKRYGFTDGGLLREAAFKFDTWLDLQFMQLLLR